MDAIVSNLEESKNSNIAEHRPSKRRKIESDSESRWRTASEQQIYSSKLIKAIQRVNPVDLRSSIGGRKIRETADRVLAVTAKGTTRWSRAILTSRLSLKLKNQKKKKKRNTKVKRSEARLQKRRRIPAIERKVKTLGRLVPGCRKISFPNLLEEATDYIAALQMQIRAMAAVADLLVEATA